MTTPDDTAALVAAARETAEQYGFATGDLLTRLAAALEAAQADRARLREACTHAAEMLTVVYERSEYWTGEQPDEQYILRVSSDMLNWIDKTRRECARALAAEIAAALNQEQPK